MTLKIQVTEAGRAALVNAQNTGTLPVTVAKIGVSDQAFAADASLTALPGQLKQLDTFSGAAVAADTIHVTIRDFSADTYSLRGFGLFLDDGTLLAVYGDPNGTVILEKSTQAAMLLATDVIFADIDAASLTFGDTNFLNPPATTEVQGVVELATDAEATAGADAVRAVTPKGLLAALNARLGAGAPSDFVKSLLTAATAAALRVLIEVKSAALYDAGAGGGLDADMLDGHHGLYYLDWNNLSDVPASFPPSAHNHDAGAIITGTLPVTRGGTGAGSFTPGNYVVGNGTGALTGKTPAQVLTDIGAAALVHSHAVSEVNGLQGALDAKAPLLSPALVGTPTAPTPVATTNSTRIATTAFVHAVVADVINGAPGALDTLKELADAMGDDPNFAATVTNALTGKLDKAGGTISGSLTVGGVFQSATPADFWNQGVSTSFLGSVGYVGTNGGFALSLRANGYRNSAGSWTSLGVNGQTKGSGIDLTPDGAIKFYAGTPVGLDVPLVGMFDSAGAFSVSPPIGSATINLVKPGSGNYSIIYGRTGTKNRWAVVPGDNATEAGANAGSNFRVTRYDDAGTFIDHPISIDRQTGVTTFITPPACPTPVAGSNNTQIATTAFVQAAIAAALANYLPKNNPTFTGTMRGPAYDET